MAIKHDNIIYVSDLSIIGGVETFVYEMVKKYHKLDIAVVYKTAHPNQIIRLKNYCPVYQHNKQDIICKVAIINYDVSIIDYINKQADIYQVVHGDYENKAYTWKPPTHQRIKEYIGITKHICDSFKRITGNENVILSYNPLTIINDKPIILVSATRLSIIKGKERMIELANALDRSNINYIWYVFTNDTDEIKSSNVIYMNPRLDVSRWISKADYLVQLSDTEACSYSINEALYRNIPVIVTPLPYLKEIGMKDKVNGYIMEFDCSNINDIVNNITNIPKFEFRHLKDSYSKLLAKGKSKYIPDNRIIVTVKCIKDYYDKEMDIDVKVSDKPFKVTKVRAYELINANVATIIEERDLLKND